MVWLGNNESLKQWSRVNEKNFDVKIEYIVGTEDTNNLGFPIQWYQKEKQVKICEHL